MIRELGVVIFAVIALFAFLPDFQGKVYVATGTIILGFIYFYSNYRLTSKLVSLK
jgi:hypothetical protein